MSVSAFTASVLTTRKLLMNVAVAQVLADGSFQSYVNYLASNGYVPPNGICTTKDLTPIFRGADFASVVQELSRPDQRQHVRRSGRLLLILPELGFDS